MARPPVKKGKRDWVILNNGELVFTYDEAEDVYKITRPRFTRALDSLIGKGFIDVTATGMGVHKVTTHYAISARWRHYGTPQFEVKKRPKPSIKNPGFKAGNNLWQKAREKKSSVKNAHGAVRDNDTGGIIAMRTNAHGQKVTKLYKSNGSGWLAYEIA